MADAVGQEWARKLFAKSVLKRRKLAEVLRALGSFDGLRCLDLGSDNGVVSLLLRERGGRWASGDLTEEAVASIRGLVDEDVHHVSGESLPFGDREFEAVAVVDMLEHVPDDVAFVRELGRVIRPGGVLVVNTPHIRRTWLRRVRLGLGLTDEKHGHLRPGYTRESLRELLVPGFELLESRTYSRFFSEAVDTVLNWGMERLGKKSSAKGMVVTGSDVARHAKALRLYAMLFPFVWLVTRLDGLIPWADGYMLVVRARRTP